MGLEAVSEMPQRAATFSPRLAKERAPQSVRALDLCPVSNRAARGLEAQTLPGVFFQRNDSWSWPLRGRS